MSLFAVAIGRGGGVVVVVILFEFFLKAATRALIDCER